MDFHPAERIALFIDGNSLYGAVKALGFELDYSKLQQVFTAHGRLVRAYYFTTLAEGDEYQGLVKLVDWLEFHGFTVCTKMVKTYTDGEFVKKMKGHTCVDLAVTAMEMAPHYDHAVLATGDGNYFPLIESLQRAGKRVTVLSTIKTNPAVCADDIRRQADIFVELDDLKLALKRAPAIAPARVLRPVDGGKA